MGEDENIIFTFSQFPSRISSNIIISVRNTYRGGDDVMEGAGKDFSRDRKLENLRKRRRGGKNVSRR
jgi:hypothetical protein